jgi:hypothetical protein
VLAAGPARTESLYLALSQEVFVGFRQYNHAHLTARLAITIFMIPYFDNS